jgi:hypothetical protein
MKTGEFGSEVSLAPESGEMRNLNAYKVADGNMPRITIFKLAVTSQIIFSTS